MNVIDASEESISSFCGDVVAKIASDLENKKVLVVGIASGGVPIAEDLSRCLSEVGISNSIAAVRCQRPSTKRKKKSLVGVCFKVAIRLLPKKFLNTLRVIEHYALSRKRNPNREVLTDFSGFGQFDNVLVVDDAVDSGHSLHAVKNFLDVQAPQAEVFSIAYVVTQQDPVVEPDLCKYRNVLVRFPWASDA